MVTALLIAISIAYAGSGLNPFCIYEPTTGHQSENHRAFEDQAGQIRRRRWFQKCVRIINELDDKGVENSLYTTLPPADLPVNVHTFPNIFGQHFSFPLRIITQL